MRSDTERVATALEAFAKMSASARRLFGRVSSLVARLLCLAFLLCVTLLPRRMIQPGEEIAYVCPALVLIPLAVLYLTRSFSRRRGLWFVAGVAIAMACYTFTYFMGRR